MADATVSTAGLRVLKLLVGRPARSVAELTKAAGVTRTAITEQLAELEATGLVERTVDRRSGRGRPRNLFRATPAALTLLGTGKECPLGRAVWDSIEQVGGEELVQRVVDRVSKELAESYKTRVTARTPTGRLRQVNKLLGEEGLLTDIVEHGQQVGLAKRSCLFITMFEEHRRVCQIDAKVISLLVGRPVRQVACRHDGDPCCVFEIDKRPRKSSGS